MSTKEFDYNFEMNFYDVAKSLDYSPKSFDPFPDFYALVGSSSYNSSLRDQLILDGEAALKLEYPSLKATDYMNFRRKGNRSDFEALYFSKRHILNSLVLAECAEQKGRFIDHIIDGIFSICEESSWCLPAHNTYIRDTTQFILPDSTRPVIDLFACETGELLSMIVYLLGKELDKVSDFITKRIRSEVYKRVISPYLNEHFWWMGNGDEPMCNWTPWCTQNVLLCAFLDYGQDISDADLKTIFIKASASVDYFLKDYGDDGCCDEGAQYYKHAGLCLYGCMEILNAISDNAFNKLYFNEKIKNIAAYISHMHIDGPWYFNFSDCSPKAGTVGVREYLFGKRTGQNFMCDFAASDFARVVNENALTKDESIKLNLYYRTQTYYYAEEVLTYKYSDTDASKLSDIWYKSVGLMILRSENISLAIKAGDNDDSHNHNDTGSVTVFKNGSPVLVDIGVETYSAKTFSSSRYDIWTMQSGYHNLPTLMGCDELPGDSHCATNVTILYDDGDASDMKGLSMNLENAYPDEVSSKYYYKREVILNKSNDEVILTDETDVSDAVLNFITYHKPEYISDSDGKLIIKIDNSQLTVQGADLINTEILPITDARLKTAWDHDLYRIRLKYTDKFSMIIS